MTDFNPAAETQASFESSYLDRALTFGKSAMDHVTGGFSSLIDHASDLSKLRTARTARLIGAAIAIPGAGLATAIEAAPASADTPGLSTPGNLMSWVVFSYDQRIMQDSNAHTPFNHLVLDAHYYQGYSDPCPKNTYQRYTGVVSYERWSRTGQYVKLCYPGDDEPIEFTPHRDLSGGTTLEARQFNWQPALNYVSGEAIKSATSEYGVDFLQPDQYQDEIPTSFKAVYKNSQTQKGVITYSEGKAIPHVKMLKSLDMTVKNGKEEIQPVFYRQPTASKPLV